MDHSRLIEAHVPSEMLAPRYFHGTKYPSVAKGILKYGLHPPDFEADGRTKNFALRPVRGRVYMTPNARHAALYGSFIFVINRDALGDLQPDEDEVGEIYHWVMQRDFDNAEQYARVHKDSPDLVALLAKLRDPTNRMRVSQFKDFMNRVLSQRTRQYMLHGEYIWWAKGGKAALKQMPEWMIIWLIGLGVHVGHAGPVMPDSAWKLHTSKGLEVDGSNLAEVATPLRLSPRATLAMPKQTLHPFRVDFEYTYNGKIRHRSEEFRAKSEEQARAKAAEFIRYGTQRAMGYRIVSVTPV